MCTNWGLDPKNARMETKNGNELWEEKKFVKKDHNISHRCCIKQSFNSMVHTIFKWYKYVYEFLKLYELNFDVNTICWNDNCRNNILWRYAVFSSCMFQKTSICHSNLNFHSFDTFKLQFFTLNNLYLQPLAVAVKPIDK